MGQELTERFKDLEGRLARERGSFVLFALFMREEVPDRWDLIIAAPWLGEDRYKAVAYFVQQISEQLGKQDLTNLTRIVVADPRDEEVAAINRSIQVEHGEVEFRDRSFFGLPVKHAVIITSKPLAAASPS